MKLFLCFAVLFAVYLIETDAVSTLTNQENDAQVMSEHLLDDVEDRHIKLKRKKRHESDRVCISNMVCDVVSKVIWFSLRLLLLFFYFLEQFLCSGSGRSAS